MGLDNIQRFAAGSGREDWQMTHMVAPLRINGDSPEQSVTVGELFTTMMLEVLVPMFPQVSQVSKRDESAYALATAAVSGLAVLPPEDLERVMGWLGPDRAKLVELLGGRCT